MKGTAVGVLLSISLLTAPALAGSIEDEVRAAVESSYATIRRVLVDPRDNLSEEGALQFWSSGGLLIDVSREDEATAYEAFDVHPKHIVVVPLSETSAAALYYAEGSMTPKGSSPVPHYLTRVLEVWVKEDGTWKQRAGHWSPLRGGGGTSRATE